MSSMITCFGWVYYKTQVFCVLCVELYVMGLLFVLYASNCLLNFMLCWQIEGINGCIQINIPPECFM